MLATLLMTVLEHLLFVKVHGATLQLLNLFGLKNCLAFFVIFTGKYDVHLQLFRIFQQIQTIYFGVLSVLEN